MQNGISMKYRARRTSLSSFAGVSGGVGFSFAYQAENPLPSSCIAMTIFCAFFVPSATTACLTVRKMFSMSYSVVVPAPPYHSRTSLTALTHRSDATSLAVEAAVMASENEAFPLWYWSMSHAAR